MTDIPKITPLMIKDRQTMMFVGRGNLDVKDSAFIVVDKSGIRKQIPIGSITCLLLEPGSRISHAAVKLASEVGTLIMWVGEAGVRLYACGQPGGASAKHLLYQAKIALDPVLRLNVVRGMYKKRFDAEPPSRRSIQQLQGMEGARVKQIYKTLAEINNVRWYGRSYNVNNWNNATLINRAISSANSCLYGICEAAILAAGYAPSIGFIHNGNASSFVFDIADILKFETVVPLAFRIVNSRTFIPDLDKVIRKECRQCFKETKMLKTLIPLIHEVLSWSGVDKPEYYKDAQPKSIEDNTISDGGVRVR